jgi:hypothetical protein
MAEHQARGAGPRGGRRARTDECAVTLQAEAVYVELQQQQIACGPGTRGAYTRRRGRHELSAEWEAVANPVWRGGRIFFRCGQCRRRATRLYLPVRSAWLACRRCWNLAYPTQWNTYPDARRARHKCERRTRITD